ncbi:MAG: DNA mismatch repair endonuclease MutL [Spirochaetaceae bacterium]|nr:DNA mismatch repair endonuclease MutL [Spirochaetaceae bacterium]
MRIHKLNSLVAQRIAAGEVIERPASVVRELIDNSIDSGATSITLALKNGGLDEIKLIDNGCGINKDDLTICCDSHTTSKVSTLEDLYHLQSLGFRGEALYSIAAVSKLTISSNYDGKGASTIVVDNGKQSDIIPNGPNIGTVISVEDLFSEIPARRQFLKRPASEALMAKNILIEKSLAFENIEFRYYNDDKLISIMPCTSRQQRILDSLATGKFKLQMSDTLILETKQDRFSIFAVAAKPFIHRSDRSHIKIYINNRAIDNYPLMQAVTRGYGELLPGGSFPYAYIFLTIDPTLVDINIHPAKKEAKIRIQSEIHHAIVMMIKNQMVRDIPQFHNKAIQENLPFESVTPLDNIIEQRGIKKAWNQKFDQGQKHTSYFNPKNFNSSSIINEPFLSDKPKNPEWFKTAKEVLGEQDILTQQELAQEKTLIQEKQAKSLDCNNYSSLEDDKVNDIESEIDFRYIGQVFNLYLAVEKDNYLYLIDQHAAHERIQYDKIKNRQGIQKLLVPLQFEVASDVDEYLLSNSDLYANMGISLSRLDSLLWEMNSIPTVYKNIESKIVEYIQNNTGNLAAIETGLFAIIACHSAIKQGDKIDDRLAIDIIKKVFKMKDPCCPHGRTFLIRFNKNELDLAVGRTV